MVPETSEPRQGIGKFSFGLTNWQTGRYNEKLPTVITTTHDSAHDSAHNTALSWSVHLARRQPQRLPRLFAALCLTFFVGLCLFHSPWPALLPPLALLLSLSEFVFPAQYQLTDKGASVRHGLTHLEIAWTDVRHAYLTEDGIKLSPLRAKNSRFEPLRGVYLRFDGANRDEVAAAVQRLRQESAARV